MSNLVTPFKQTYHAIEFRYGDVTDPNATEYYNITNWTSNIAQLGAEYISFPTLDISLPEATMSLNEQPLSIRIPIGESDEFADRISNGEPHEPIFVSCAEINVGDTNQFQVERLFVGQVATVTRNPSGDEDVIEIECEGVKQQLQDSTLNILATAYCPWTFGGRGCFFNVEGAIDPGTLTVIDGASVTITGVASPSDYYWHRGYIRRNGLRIGIRDWRSSAPTIFHLNAQPPARWIGQTVTAVPGCDKTITTCRNRWNREEFFGGIGIALVPYNPNLEQP